MSLNDEETSVVRAGQETFRAAIPEGSPLAAVLAWDTEHGHETISGDVSLISEVMKALVALDMLDVPAPGLFVLTTEAIGLICSMADLLARYARWNADHNASEENTCQL
jgi:hypothetical protein